MLKIYPTVRSPNEMHAKTLHCLFPRLEEAPTAEAIKRSTKRYPPLDMEGAFIQRLAAVRVVEIGGQSTAAAAAAAAAAVAVELAAELVVPICTPTTHEERKQHGERRD
jgi:hypothetical protein